MANQFVTAEKVAKSIQAALEPKLMLGNSLSREFDKEFEGEVAGNTRRVKFLPHVPVTHNNLAYDPKAYIEKYKDITLDQTTSAFLNFGALETITEMGLEGLVKTNANVLNSYVNELEKKLAGDIIPLGGQALIVPAVDFKLATLRSAHTRLITATNGGGGQVQGLFSSEHLATVKNDSQALAAISPYQANVYEQGQFEKYDGIKIGTCEYVPDHVTGTRNTVGTVSVNYVEGSDSIVLAGLGANATILKGEIFTVAGVRRYSLKTNKTSSNLYQFVALEMATATAGGIATVKIEPIYATNAGNFLGWKNVNILPASGNVTAVLGAAGQTYGQGVIYLPTFAGQYWGLPRPIMNSQGAIGISSKSSKLRVPFSFWESPDFNSYGLKQRLDAFHGNSVLRPEEAVRIILT